MDLHRFEFFCEDKNVARITRAISGLALPQGLVIQPVVNVVKQNGGKVVALTGGTRLEMFAEWLRRSNLAKISRSDAREFLSQSGFAVTGVQSLFYGAVEVGLLRKAKGIRNGYDVVNPNPTIKGK